MPTGIYKHKTNLKAIEAMRLANLGKKRPPMSEEQKKKLSISLKGRTVWNKGTKGVMVNVNKGKKLPEEWIEKLRISHKGQHPVNVFVKGDPRITGKNAHSWKGGVTPLNEKIRKSKEYKLWRKAIFERDNYTCIWCGQVGGFLEADHIKPFSLFPELRFAIDNGRTLCKSCHKKTNTYGWKGALWS